MNAVLEWVKANVFIVVFAVLMVAAAVALPYFASGMNQGVREVVTKRVQDYNKLAQLEKGEVLPGHQGIVSEATLHNYEEAAQSAAADAASVRDAAIQHNRKDRVCVLDKTLFPDPPQSMIDVMPLRFYEAISDAYGKLLNQVGAGMPPDPAMTRQQLDQVRTQFITQDLKKDVAETLTPEEQKQLSDVLAKARISLYADAASNLEMFLSMDQLGVPQWNQSNQPSLGELYNWQWQFWIVDDILRALHEANKADKSVVRAPVKHILSLTVMNLPAVSEANRGSSTGGAARGFGAGGFGAGGDAGADPSSAQPAGGAAMPADPKAPVPLNYSASLTGRTTNPLYDVIYVDLDMVVETARLPQVLDEIAKYNFMTVTAPLQLIAVDPYVAVENGFYYGAAPVTEVRMRIETVWLRAWTQEFMPKSVKRELGIPEQPAAGAATPSA